MRLSDDRTTHLAHKTAEALQALAGGLRGLRPFTKEPSDLLAEVKKAFREFDRIWTEVDREATEKVHSLKRNVPEGSREWDILYRQYFEEGLQKRKP